MTDIYKFMSAKYHPVKVQANILMSNVLYYNGPNRARFLEIEGSTELVLSYVDERADVSIVEASLRSMLSLSYLDTVSIWLGGDGDMIPLFLSFLRAPYYTRDAMRCSLEIVCNLCVHVANRNVILLHGGIDALVSLHVDDDFYIRDLSMQILDHLKVRRALFHCPPCLVSSFCELAAHVCPILSFTVFLLRHCAGVH